MQGKILLVSMTIDLFLYDFLIHWKYSILIFSSRYDGCSRNIHRHEDLKDAATISKISDHFIFTVESTGALLPENLVIQAIDILSDKCDIFLSELDRNVKNK